MADDQEPTLSAWLPWYFGRGLRTFVTLPLFLLLAFALLTSAFGALVQWLAAVRVSWALMGVVGGLVVACVVWLPAIISPALYYSLLKNLPGLWSRPDASAGTKLAMSVGVLVGMPLIAWVVSAALGWGIGWMADRDPCAAFRAGVTGSVEPTACE
jgi:hypothetical protein